MGVIAYSRQICVCVRHFGRSSLDFESRKKPHTPPLPPPPIHHKWDTNLSLLALKSNKFWRRKCVKRGYERHFVTRNYTRFIGAPKFKNEKKTQNFFLGGVVRRFLRGRESLTTKIFEYIQGVTGKFQDCASKNRTGFAIYKPLTVV